MRKYQRGVSLGGLMIAAVILIVVALAGLKVGPAYGEYFSIKKTVTALAQEKQGGTVAEIRKAFDARAQIDDISAVKATDLEITKEGSEVVIAFGYRKEVPLFKNIGLFIDFAGNSKG
jgi:Tfp pilus assembly major pilin PilA